MPIDERERESIIVCVFVCGVYPQDGGPIALNGKVPIDVLEYVLSCTTISYSYSCTAISYLSANSTIVSGECGVCNNTIVSGECIIMLCISIIGGWESYKIVSGECTASVGLKKETNRARLFMWNKNKIRA